MNIRVLLVEDDDTIVENLTGFLKEEGCFLVCAPGQKDAVRLLSEESFDLALLDISLKDGNGFSVCSAIKSISDMPVIFLTASDDEYSVVAGLDMGADDFIGKPFRPRELLSRMKSVLRRSGRVKSLLEIGNLKVDTEKAQVSKNGQEIFLSALEYRLLLVFLNNKNMVLSRSRLLEEIWDIAGEFVNDNTLTVYIKRLRDKIEDEPWNPKIIKTIRGLGYKAGD